MYLSIVLYECYETHMGDNRACETLRIRILTLNCFCNIIVYYRWTVFAISFQHVLEMFILIRFRNVLQVIALLLSLVFIIFQQHQCWYTNPQNVASSLVFLRLSDARVVALGILYYTILYYTILNYTILPCLRLPDAREVALAERAIFCLLLLISIMTYIWLVLYSTYYSLFLISPAPGWWHLASMAPAMTHFAHSYLALLLWLCIYHVYLYLSLYIYVYIYIYIYIMHTNTLLNGDLYPFSCDKHVFDSYVLYYYHYIHW